MKFHTEADLEWVEMFDFIAKKPHTKTKKQTKKGNSCAVQSVLQVNLNIQQKYGHSAEKRIRFSRWTTSLYNHSTWLSFCRR